jgi:TolB protein
MIRFKRYLHIASSVFLLMTGISHGYAAPTEIEVTASRFEPMPIAVPFFHGNNPQLAQKIRDIVVNDLQNSGLFRVIPPQSYLSQPTISEVPQFENWRPLGAAAIVVGDVIANGNDIGVSFRLWDIGTGQEILGQQFRGNGAIMRRLGHKMADSVYSQLTGEGPYFDSHIVFVDEVGPKNNRRKRLAVMDQDGANVRYLTSRNEYILSPRYSAKAQRIVFTTLDKNGSALHLMDPSTGRRERLIYYPNRMVFSPALSPDGQNVAFSLESGGNTDIYMYNIPSRRMYPITSGFAIDTSPSFSPDGSQIVFNSDMGGTQQLYVTSSSGGGTKRISYGAGRYATPLWSPKGDKIAFTRMQGGKFSIGIMTPDGGNERILASSFLDEAPSWAPNGRSVVFFRQIAGRTGQTNLYQVDISGYIPERRIQTPQDASDPSWSPLLQ